MEARSVSMLTIHNNYDIPLVRLQAEQFANNIPFAASDKTAIPSLEPQKAVEGSPTVRFASNNEEIEPATIDCLDQVPSPQNIPPEEQAQLKELSKTLHGAHLQERRMSHFAFEPVSLPASRVCYKFLSPLPPLCSQTRSSDDKGNLGMDIDIIPKNSGYSWDET